MNMDEAIQVSCIIDKLPPWKDFKHTLKHKKEELTLIELGSHLRIEESLTMQDSDKPKGNNVVGPAVVRLLDPKLKTLVERGIECIFVGYAKHSKAFRVDSSVPRPSLKIPNETEDIGGSVVPEEVTEEIVQQPESELRKSKRNMTKKNFRPEFQLYLIEGIRDKVFDQHTYYFNVEDNPKTFDEAIHWTSMLGYMDDRAGVIAAGHRTCGWELWCYWKWSVDDGRDMGDDMLA
ncbi:hypothetical protein Tco_1353501 [Tanacetum coccineum]